MQLNKVIEKSIKKYPIFFLAVSVFLLTRIVIYIAIYLQSKHIPDISFDVLTGRLSTWDSAIYIQLATEGYPPNPDLVHAFLPGWPLFLRYSKEFLDSLGFSLTYIEIGLLINQVFNFVFIYNLLKFIKKIGFSLHDNIMTVLLILFYPASFFLNTNYNEAFYLAFLSSIVLLWVNNRKTLSVWVAFLAVIFRHSIIVAIAGMVIWQIICWIYNKIKDKKLSKQAIKEISIDIFTYLKKKWYFVFSLLALPIPIATWFYYQYDKYGEVRYLVTQKNFFNREADFILGPKNTFSEVFGSSVNSIPSVATHYSQTTLATIFFLLGIVGFWYLFSTLDKNLTKHVKDKKIYLSILLLYSVCTLSIAIYIIKEPRVLAYFNNQFVVDMFINFIPLMLIFVGLVSIFLSKNLRFFGLASIFTLLLPISTSTFTSINRYILHAYPVFISTYEKYMLKNKLLVYTVLIIFYIIYNLFAFRFMRFQWIG